MGFPPWRKKLKGIPTLDEIHSNTDREKKSVMRTPNLLQYTALIKHVTRNKRPMGHIAHIRNSSNE